jgi:hypothetical protein
LRRSPSVSGRASGAVMHHVDVPWRERVRLLRHLLEPMTVFGIVMGSL